MGAELGVSSFGEFSIIIKRIHWTLFFVSLRVSLAFRFTIFFLYIPPFSYSLSTISLWILLQMASPTPIILEGSASSLADASAHADRHDPPTHASVQYFEAYGANPDSRHFAALHSILFATCLSMQFILTVNWFLFYQLSRHMLNFSFWKPWEVGVKIIIILFVASSVLLIS